MWQLHGTSLQIPSKKGQHQNKEKAMSKQYKCDFFFFFHVFYCNTLWWGHPIAPDVPPVGTVVMTNSMYFQKFN